MTWCIFLFPALEHWWMTIPPFLFLVHVMLLSKANYTDDVTLGHLWFPYLCSFQSNRPWSKMYMRVILFFLLNKINDTPPLFWFRHWSSLAVMLLVAIGSLINFISSCAAEPLLLCTQEDVCAGSVSLLSYRDPVKLYKPILEARTTYCRKIECSHLNTNCVYNNLQTYIIFVKE